MLKYGVPYRELGGDYFDQKNPERVAKRLIGRLERLGYIFLVPPVAPVIPLAPIAPKLAALPLVTAGDPPKRKRGRPRKMPTLDLLTTVICGVGKSILRRTATNGHIPKANPAN